MLIKVLLCSPPAICPARSLSFSLQSRCRLLLIRLGVNLIWGRMNLSHGLLAHCGCFESHLLRRCTPILSLSPSFFCYVFAQALLSFLSSNCECQMKTVPRKPITRLCLLLLFSFSLSVWKANDRVALTDLNEYTAIYAPFCCLKPA